MDLGDAEGKQVIDVTGLNTQVWTPTESCPGLPASLQVVGGQIGGCEEVFAKARSGLMPFVYVTVTATEHIVIHYQLVFAEMQQDVQNGRGRTEMKATFVLRLLKIVVADDIQLDVQLVQRAFDSTAAGSVEVGFLIYRAVGCKYFIGLLRAHQRLQEQARLLVLEHQAQGFL